jgi:hypothetical protein
VKTRLAATIVLTSAVVLGTAGCTLFAPTGTLKPYQPSDGVAANISEIKVRNLLAVSSDGKDLSLSFTVINNDDVAQTLNVQYKDASGARQTVTVTVPAMSLLTVGGAENQLVLRDADAQVGGLVAVYLQYGSEPGAEVLVPVLDDRLGSYEGFLPSPAPTPTETATPEPTSPEPTESAAP